MSIVELCKQHIEAVPMNPSQRLGKPVSAELEHALLACLEKSRTKRPATARDMAQLLARCPTATTWSQDASEAWWGRHERGLSVAPATIPETSQSSAGYDRTVITNRPEPE